MIDFEIWNLEIDDSAKIGGKIQNKWKSLSI